MSLDRLHDPIDPARVKQREGGGGKRLSYIASHDAIRTANEIFGYGGWSSNVQELVFLGTEPFTKETASGTREGVRAAYRATVKVTARIEGDFDGKIHALRDVSFTDTGYGDAIEYGKSVLTVQELASKEAVSDAQKRALRHLGDQFGLSLYSDEGRAAVAQAAKAADGVKALKLQVKSLAMERLNTEKPTGEEIAALFGVGVSDLQKAPVLRQIIAAHDNYSDGPGT